MGGEGLPNDQYERGMLYMIDDASHSSVASTASTAIPKRMVCFCGLETWNRNSDGLVELTRCNRDKCGQMFHTACITKMMVNPGSNRTCPFCTQPLVMVAGATRDANGIKLSGGERRTINKRGGTRGRKSGSKSAPRRKHKLK